MAAAPVEELGEMRVGEWEGRTFEDLDAREDWKRFNSVRSMVRPPGGEWMIETQTRMIRQLQCLGLRHPGQQVAVVSHGDPLRAALAYCLDMPLNSVLRLEVGLASVSVIELGDWGPRVLCINQTGEIAV